MTFKRHKNTTMNSATTGNGKHRLTKTLSRKKSVYVYDNGIGLGRNRPFGLLGGV